MAAPPEIQFRALDLDAIAGFEGRVVVFLPEDGKLDRAARRVNTLTRHALERLAQSEAFGNLKEGEGLSLGFPAGLAAQSLLVIRLARNAGALPARSAGAAIGAANDGQPVLVLAGALARPAELALGLALRSYSFGAHLTTPGKTVGTATVMVTRPEALDGVPAEIEARAEAVHFTRDLVNEPANVLTTSDFAARLSNMQALGLEVEVMEEDALGALGMNALLAVGQGSASPSKVVVMRWNGGGKAAPLALIGKGVVFDTGGISIKPAAGMEEMTMDMGGAAVVAGTMRALARRKAAANVVGLVGLVENMPSGTAMRPGDIVKSMKGDSIEIINTDAEGRLVLADLLWYAQDRFAPQAMIDLATLTGAIIIALGHEKAGVFANDDALCAAFLAAATAEGEGAWQMPLDREYDELLKSRLADVKNVGGRPAGAVTAAQFLQRFVKSETPWLHLDIAGVARPAGKPRFAPKGASGWGVLALDRLVRDRYEGAG